MGKVRFLIIFLILNMELLIANVIPCYEIDNAETNLHDFEVGLLIDESNELSLLDIINDSISIVNSRYFISNSTTANWFVFQVKNTGSRINELIVGFDEVFFETVDIYYEKDSEWYTEHNGFAVQFHKRPVQNRCPVFKVELKPGETKTIFLKGYSKFSMLTGITVEDELTFQKKDGLINMMYWLYFGAALAMFIYNLFLFFQIREKVYLYYVLYIACFVIFIALYSGFFQYLTANVAWIVGSDSAIGIMGVFLALFTRELLQVRKQSKWIDNIIIANVFIYAAFAILILIDIKFFIWLLVYSGPSSLFLLFVGICCWVRKVPLAKYYVIAISGLLIGLMFISVLNIDILPYNVLTRYSFIFGSFIELTVFSLALGYRVKLLQDQKESYHLKLLASEKMMKENLEKQVADRTTELNKVNKELEELLHFKEDMTTNIIHDLKSPLNAILNADAVENDKSWLKMVKYSGFKMLNLIQDILDVYKYENTQIELNKESISLEEIISEAVEEVHFIAVQKSIGINLRIDNNYIISIDVGLMHRVVVNILTNAIKHSPIKKDISLHTEMIENGLLKFSILNHGPGIPKGEQEVIFEKFVQAKGDKQNTNFSSGIGLAFCKIAVEAHGGKIGVVSNSTKGVRFWFEIPVFLTNLQIQKDKTSDETMVFLLLHEDKDYLSSFIGEIRRFEMYEITSINKILKQIEHKTPAIKAWCEQLEIILYTGNLHAFNSLLNV